MWYLISWMVEVREDRCSYEFIPDNKYGTQGQPDPPNIFIRAIYPESE